MGHYKKQLLHFSSPDKQIAQTQEENLICLVENTTSRQKPV